jgi:CHAD domain-containing protein
VSGALPAGRGGEAEVFRFLAGGRPPSRLLPRLARAGYAAQEPGREVLEELLLETQDGRLRKAGLRLGIARRGDLVLWRMEGPGGAREGVLEGGWAGSCAAPPVERLPEEAAAAASGRRLLPLLRLRLRREARRLSAPGGSELEMAWDTASGASPWAAKPAWVPAPALVTVTARGEAREEGRHLAIYLRDRLGLEPASADAVGLALGVLGLPEPGAPSPERFVLHADDPLALAARKIVGLQAMRMWANTEGTLRDLDPEYLHDLRVATRRLRAALRLLAPVLGPRRCGSLRVELGWIGRLLGAVRDLDVFLGNLDIQAARLGSGAAVAGLLAQELRRRREPEFEALAAALASRRYSALLRRLRTLGDSPPPRRPRGPQGLPAGRAAGEMIRAANRRVLKAGRRLAPDSPPLVLHRLRILIKRLRYTAEFFREAFRAPDGSDRLAKILDALVQFQDCLGEHQDAVVAMARIRALAEEMAREGKMPSDQLLELGALIQVQREIARERRDRLQALWARYDRRAVRRRLARLLPPEPGETSQESGA